MAERGDVNSAARLTQIDHQAVLDMLPEYVMLATERRDPERVFPAVARHLAACDACREALAELLQLTAIVYSGSFAAPIERPNLGFLRQDSVIPAAPVLTRSSLGQLTVTFSRPIVAALLQPRLAGAFRGQLLWRGVLAVTERPAAQVQLEIRAEDVATCTITVTLQLSDRGPLAQHGAAMHLTAPHLAMHGVSDEVGTVAFPGVPLEALPLLHLMLTPAPSPPQSR